LLLIAAKWSVCYLEYIGYKANNDEKDAQSFRAEIVLPNVQPQNQTGP
jgi:hypothetical protein